MSGNQPETAAAGSPDRRDEPADLSYKAHRQIIGYLGLALPFFLRGLAGVRSAPNPQRWLPLGSVSAYYYTGAVAGFVGVLFALALFLLTYRGYANDRADRIAGAIGGICALCVALFPTTPPEGPGAPDWWSPTTRYIHYGSAGLLFVVFIVFAIWLFRRTDVPTGHELPPDKKWRNRLFLFLGLVMIACIVWAASSLRTGAPIFWAEAIALWAFAISWLVKGDAHRTVIEAARSALGANASATAS